MSKTIFWDVDTQVDFILPYGKLYITGAEKILPNLDRLTRHARNHGFPIFGSVDNHNPNDVELSDNPDFQDTFPPHCLQGTTGQKKVPETRAQNPLWVDFEPAAPEQLTQKIQNHSGEILFHKRYFDVFSNPNVDPILNIVKPKQIVIYGVALDVCNAFAIEGFLKRKTAPLALVLDASQPILKKRGERLVKKWKTLGVGIVTTDKIVNKT